MTSGSSEPTCVSTSFSYRFVAIAHATTWSYCFSRSYSTFLFSVEKKLLKQLALDHDSLTVKERPVDHTCSTRTELELVQAFRRRALAFDLVGIMSYETMNSYHAELLSHLQEDAPPGYSNTTVVQVLGADRAAFLHLAEIITSLKRDANGDLPLEVELPKVLVRPSVSFHLLPLASQVPKAQPAAKTNPNNQNKRRHEETKPPTKDPSNTRGQPARKGKGKGKSKTKRGRGPNVPKDLVGKSLETVDGRRICWPYNLSSGCTDATPGGQCSRGMHVCAEPGCGKSHSLQNHSWLPEVTEGSFASFEAKLSAKCFKKTAHELFVIEVFAGTCRLTASLRQLGLRDSFGVDHILAAPVLQLDLLKPECLEFIEQIILEDACVYVHFAPPCGTASRARFIRRKGRYNPPVLRTDANPNGPTGYRALALHMQPKWQQPTNCTRSPKSCAAYATSQVLCTPLKTQPIALRGTPPTLQPSCKKFPISVLTSTIACTVRPDVYIPA